MFSEYESLPPKKLDIPWFGGRFSDLPQSVQQAFTNHFDLLETPNNVSILTENKIQTSIYYLNSYKHLQIECALIICKNLNKKLIVIHHHKIMDYIANSPCVLFCLDIESKPVNILVEQLQTHFYHEYSHQADNQDASNAPNSQQPLEQVPLNNDFARKLMVCLDHIQSNLHQPIKIETLAEMCHCSTCYFSRQFHSVVGMSFRSYVSLKRTEIAKHMLLTQPNEKISSIAFQCGFHDEAYFTRHFKKKVGITPSSYRQKYLQSN